MEHRRETEKKEKEAKRARRAIRTAAFRKLLDSFKGIKVGLCCSGVLMLGGATSLCNVEVHCLG